MHDKKAYTMIKCVSFDLWNTLIHNLRYSELRMDILLNYFLKENILIAKKDLENYYNQKIKAYQEKQRKDLLLHVYPKQIIKQIFKNFKISFPPPYLQDLITSWEKLMLDNPPQLKSNVEKTLVDLKKKYKLVVISDTGITPGKIIRKIFERYDILQFFDLLVFSDEIGLKKPHLTPFQQVVDNLGVSAQECIHIGDLLYTDVLGANRAGFHSIWYTDDNVDINAQFEILKMFKIEDKKNLQPNFRIYSYKNLKMIIESI
jgi:putative hydrolase of the HAD superfamily